MKKIAIVCKTREELVNECERLRYETAKYEDKIRERGRLTRFDEFCYNKDLQALTTYREFLKRDLTEFYIHKDKLVNIIQL